jgi:hypothetical protein
MAEAQDQCHDHAAPSQQNRERDTEKNAKHVAPGVHSGQSVPVTQTMPTPRFVIVRHAAWIISAT